jgi:hypothetical protein
MSRLSVPTNGSLKLEACDARRASAAAASLQRGLGRCHLAAGRGPPAQGPAGKSRPGPIGPPAAACAPDKRRPGRSSAAMSALGSSPPIPGKPAGAPGAGLNKPAPRGPGQATRSLAGKMGTPRREGSEPGSKSRAPAGESAPSAPYHAGGPQVRAFAGQKGHGPPGGSSERAPVGSSLAYYPSLGRCVPG